MSSCLRLLALLLTLLTLSHAALAQPPPSRAEALAAMKRATQFMLDKVSYRGGYVWSVSEDFTRRDGEVPARATQIWIQGGTPAVGHAYLDAYEVTGDHLFLAAARRAAAALVHGQRPEGGWHYFIDFDARGTEEWYRAEASRFKWGYEEYRHFYGNSTFDDGNTAEAARYLLRFYATTRETVYRRPLVRALDFMLKAQYPNGAWPQRYPPSSQSAHDGRPDYTPFYTLNDGAASANILTLVAGYELLGDERYLESAKRGVDFLIAVQGPEGQAAWAEQYDPKTMEPAAARTHEPPGFVVRESVEVVQLLETFYLMTRSRRYLRPIPGAIAWLERVNRETVELKRPPARYYQLDTNLPVYVTRTEKTNDEGYGLYKWSTTEARGDGFGLYRSNEETQPIRDFIEVEPIRREYERIARLTPEAARGEYERRRSDAHRPTAPRPGPPVADIIKALDARGAWVTDIWVLTRVARPSISPGTRERMRGYSTSVFIRNLRALTEHFAALDERDTSKQSAPRAVTWMIDNLAQIGGHKVTVIGAPRVIQTNDGRAVLFDGERDGLLIENNPVEGARAFTVEAVIRPDAGGPDEQRWLHIQEASADNRVMLETRLRGGHWFLDTFIKSGPAPENRLTLYDEPFKHPVGAWHHVALVYDGEVMRNYVDGREELSGPLKAAPLAAGRTSIGVRQNRVHWFKGAIRKARFTPRALSPREFTSKD